MTMDQAARARLDAARASIYEDAKGATAPLVAIVGTDGMPFVMEREHAIATVRLGHADVADDLEKRTGALLAVVFYEVDDDDPHEHPRIVGAIVDLGAN
jgi:hypothetical protein